MEPRRTERSIGEGVEILTVPDVAAYLRVTTKTVYSLIREAALPSFRIGRVLRCRRVDVEAFVSQRAAASSQPMPRQTDGDLP